MEIKLVKIIYVFCLARVIITYNDEFVSDEALQLSLEKFKEMQNRKEQL